MDRGRSREILESRLPLFRLMGLFVLAVATFSYVIAGLPHWPILALLTFVLAMVQVSPGLVWGPAALWLWMGDQPGLAVFVAVWGLLVVGLSDNFVKALVLSRGAHIPAFLAFLGAIGGLLTWGIVGIFVGPVIVGVTYQLVVQWLAEDRAPPDAD